MRERLRPLRLLGIMELGGIIALMGCSGDSAVEALEPTPQPDEVTGTPIAFSGGLQEEQTVTRATPLQGNDGSGVTFFKVYGFKNTNVEYSQYQLVFPGYVVNWVNNTANSSTTNSSGWEYVNQQPLGQAEQTVKYWDWNARAYRFFGVAGATGTNVVTGGYKKYNEGTDSEYMAYDVRYEANANEKDKIPYYSHLWFSDGSYGQKPFGQPVELQFLKPFSTVCFSFIFEEPLKARETTLTDKYFHPTSGTSIKMKGKVTVSYPLTGSATTEAFFVDNEAEGPQALTEDYYVSFEREDPTNPLSDVISPYYQASPTSLNKVYTVLPVTGQGNYTMTVSVNGEPKTTTVPAAFMDWLPGYKYTYIFKIHIDGSVTIDKVQSAFTPWEDHSKDYTIYNW